MSDKKILVGDMSRETAIGILKLMLEAMEVYDSIAPTPQRRNAVQMAISSLETDEAYQFEYEQTTKNDLEVDTDKLIADCEKMSFDFELFGRPMKALLLDAVKNIVKDLPSVTSIRPKGHWIPLGNYDDWGNESSYKCSECGEIDTYPDNFCPNCGADMREVEEREDKE